jgi:hypothetical protein
LLLFHLLFFSLFYFCRARQAWSTPNARGLKSPNPRHFAFPCRVVSHFLSSPHL